MGNVCPSGEIGTLIFRKTLREFEFDTTRSPGTPDTIFAQTNAPFRCQCRHSWTSDRSTVQFDFKNLKVKHIFGQSCRHCNYPSYPLLEEHHWRQLILCAMERFECIRNGRQPKPTPDSSEESTDQHHVLECEACIIGMKHCRTLFAQDESGWNIAGATLAAVAIGGLAALVASQAFNTDESNNVSSKDGSKNSNEQNKPRKK